VNTFFERLRRVMPLIMLLTLALVASACGGDGDDEVSGEAGGGQERREKLAEETDDLLDEIDDVLEENAEDFVRAYVQKGGQ